MTVVIDGERWLVLTMMDCRWEGACLNSNHDGWAG